MDYMTMGKLNYSVQEGNCKSSWGKQTKKREWNKEHTRVGCLETVTKKLISK